MNKEKPFSCAIAFLSIIALKNAKEKNCSNILDPSVLKINRFVARAIKAGCPSYYDARDHIADTGKKEPFPQTHENGVKIPVISMEDVSKLAKEMEK